LNQIIDKEIVDIENMIYEIRGKQVMLASDVGKLYQSETKIINQVVKRNINRFPEEFCFQLTKAETDLMCSRSQIVTLNERGRNIKYLPYVFTEQGVAMLSSVLRTELASLVSVDIMRAFVAMRRYLSCNLNGQQYINEQVIKNTEDIKLLKQTFIKFEEKKVINEIFFNGQIYDAYSKTKDILSVAKNEIVIKSLIEKINNLN